MTIAVTIPTRTRPTTIQRVVTVMGLVFPGRSASKTRLGPVLLRERADRVDPELDPDTALQALEQLDRPLALHELCELGNRDRRPAIERGPPGEDADVRGR